MAKENRLFLSQHLSFSNTNICWQYLHLMEGKARCRLVLMWSDINAFFASAVFTLFLALFIAALQIRGIINVTLARILFAVGWLIVVIGAAASLNDAPLRHRVIAAIVVGTPVGILLLVTEIWAARNSKARENALATSQLHTKQKHQEGKSNIVNAPHNEFEPHNEFKPTVVVNVSASQAQNQLQSLSPISQPTLSAKIEEVAVDETSRPTPNIVCIGEYDGYVLTDEQGVFREYNGLDNSRKYALSAVFCNEPNPPQKISEINNVEAQIFLYDLDYPESLIYRVQRGYWLNEKSPYASFGRNSVRKLIIGTMEDLKFTVFENTSDSDGDSLPSKKTIRCPAGYKIKVRLVGGEHSEWSREFEFELRMPSEASYGFQYLSEKVKKVNKEFAKHHLGRFIGEGRRLLHESVKRDKQFYAEANKWCNEVERFIREFLLLRQAKKFSNITELRHYQHTTSKKSKRFLDELYTRFVNLEEIAKEYEED